MRTNRAILALIGSTSLALASTACAQTLEEATVLAAEARWPEAAAAYQGVVAASPENSTAWFGLGQARHQLSEHEAAVEAYLRALEAGFQPRARVHYHLGRAYMSLGDEERALEQIEAIGALGGVPPQVLQGVAEFEPLREHARYQAVIEQLTPCVTERYRDFDFWLGEWDVTPAGMPAPTARNSITSVQGGCAVLEQYETQGGFTGMSINFYDSVTGKWHQSWMGSGGGAVHLQGGLENGAMVMSDADLAVSEISGTINRVTWSLLDDGRVRQHWEITTDGGESWTTSFDGYYSPSVEEE